MSKPSHARSPTTKWSRYMTALRRHGSLLIWLDKEMTWLAPPDGIPGRPAVFPDAAIQFCLTIKVLFSLPHRQTTGMVDAIARNETLRATWRYGWAFSTRWTGYHARSRIEAKMRCLKAFGERIAARHPDSQTAEIVREG